MGEIKKIQVEDETGDEEGEITEPESKEMKECQITGFICEDYFFERK